MDETDSASWVYQFPNSENGTWIVTRRTRFRMTPFWSSGDDGAMVSTIETEEQVGDIENSQWVRRRRRSLVKTMLLAMFPLYDPTVRRMTSVWLIWFYIVCWIIFIVIVIRYNKHTTYSVAGDVDYLKQYL